MKQVLQNLRDGTTELAEVPAPGVARGRLLVRTRVSLVSPGTERMLVEFGKANWIAKARQQPDKVRMVLEKVRTDGLATTWDAVQSKLDQPLELGYCNVGEVIGVGSDVTGFAVGDRVVSNGRHAELVSVPANLCARIPDGVSDENAAFTVLTAIGLQGIRLANPTLGECVVVVGLGLIGLLTVRLLVAQGCRVMGIDFDPAKLALAAEFGAEAVVNAATNDGVLDRAMEFSRGRGVDSVIITASTASNEPVSQAARMCRKRGRIVLVGVTGLQLSRAEFYEKELTFQVSCSYGPGRYDPAYEERGQDYPVGFVRWTEQRNFEAVLDLMAARALDPARLISHRFRFDDSVAAYDLLASDRGALGIVMQYEVPAAAAEDAPARFSARTLETGGIGQGTSGGAAVTFLGAGNYAGRVLMPAFKAAGAGLRSVASAGGVSAAHFGRKFGFARVSTDWRESVDDSGAGAVVIATRHNLHAQQVLAALRAGKHVFCEKPLCLQADELAEIEAEAGSRPAQVLTVGFNRRFSPLVKRVKQLVGEVAGPKVFIATVNAGAIPAEHWTQDRQVGGGRIVGEACHFVDLLRHLAGAPIVRHDVLVSGGDSVVGATGDVATLILSFADGSSGTIHYLANGHKGFPKERIEVFCAGRILQLDNFRSLRGWGWRNFSSTRLWKQDKGQNACVEAFLAAIAGRQPAPIPLDELIEVSRVSIALQAAVNSAA